MVVSCKKNIVKIDYRFLFFISLRRDNIITIVGNVKYSTNG